MIEPRPKVLKFQLKLFLSTNRNQSRSGGDRQPHILTQPAHQRASLPAPQVRVFTREKKGRVNRNEGALTSSSPLGEVAWTENSSDGKWQEDGRFVSVFTSKPNGLLFAITVEMEVGMKFDGICPK